MKLAFLPTLAALLFAFAVACSGGEEGQECDVNDDCDDGLVCARIAECPDGDCIGICLARCDSDEACPGDQFCGSQIGAPERVCHLSTGGPAPRE